MKVRFPKVSQISRFLWFLRLSIRALWSADWLNWILGFLSTTKNSVNFLLFWNLLLWYQLSWAKKYLVFCAKDYVAEFPHWIIQRPFIVSLAKGVFFLKVRFFFKSQNLKKKVFKKLSWTWNLNFPPITLYCCWREI